MKKAPINPVDFSRYTDTTASIRISQNGHGSYVGIGKISLEDESANTLCVKFQKRVGIQSRQTLDELTSTPHLEPEAIQGTYAVDQVERFSPIEIIGKKDDELHLRSKKATIKIYFHPSLTGEVIKSMVDKQTPRK